MNSLRKLYRAGFGPSSSHTIGVGIAATVFKKVYPAATAFRATLYGSLALTGVGHGTDDVIKKTLGKVEIVFDKRTTDITHPNTFDLACSLGHARFLSTGGGDIKIEEKFCSPEILAFFSQNHSCRKEYPHRNFADIAKYCAKNKLRLYEYVYKYECGNIQEFLLDVWNKMKKAVASGLSKNGTLPGGLKLRRQARTVYETADKTEHTVVSAYALAVAEENAGNGLIVTAPTCGACGVVPAVLLYMQQQYNLSDDKVVAALATGGLVGNIIKTNASVSGAECGCQAEIGSACSMAAAALCELFDLPIPVIEAAAAIAMEHNLGLTCDPILGLVQVPCIERNAMAANKTINAMRLAKSLALPRTVSFDQVVDIMYRTGLAMHADYKETSLGGLATLHFGNSPNMS